jgi:membrane-bound lytic murein transglycosylase B
LLTLFGFSCSQASASNYQTAANNAYSDPAVQTYIQKISKKYHMKQSMLTKLFKQVHFKPSIIRKINHPYEKVVWERYQRIFVNPTRASQGEKFWHKHKKTLRSASTKSHVPESVIIAIIGVETKYGQHTADYRVIDALSTLAFKYPKRAKFFKSELTQLLLLSREQKIDPLYFKGSYAGAIGIPQFMPSSYRRYGVDFNKDGKADLVNSMQDAIGSIANYLHHFNWHEGEPVAISAKINAKHKKLPEKNILKPGLTLTKLSRAGIHPITPLDHDYAATLITENSEHGKKRWLGFNNFYVISRYNPSSKYVLAVHQLSQKIAKLHYKKQTKSRG